VAGRASSLEVRAPDEAELAAVLALARRMHQLGTYSTLPFDARKVAGLIASCVRAPGHFASIAVHRGEVSGFLGGRMGTYPFCDEPLAYDLGFFVAPEARRSSAAVRLFRAFEAWAMDRGAREVSMAVSTGVDVERIGAFYVHMGLTCIGGVYRKALR
jgi:GNAT superfamily N-acetyltransferase